MVSEPRRCPAPPSAGKYDADRDARETKEAKDKQLKKVEEARKKAEQKGTDLHSYGVCVCTLHQASSCVRCEEGGRVVSRSGAEASYSVPAKYPGT